MKLCSRMLMGSWSSLCCAQCGTAWHGARIQPEEGNLRHPYLRHPATLRLVHVSGYVRKREQPAGRLCQAPGICASLGVQRELGFGAGWLSAAQHGVCQSAELTLLGASHSHVISFSLPYRSSSSQHEQDVEVKLSLFPSPRSL